MIEREREMVCVRISNVLLNQNQIRCIPYKVVPDAILAERFGPMDLNSFIHSQE